MDLSGQPIGGPVPGEQPRAGQPQYDSSQQATLVPMPDGWAAGVSPVVISRGSHRGRWAIAGAVVLIVALLTAGGAFVLSGAGGQKSLTASAPPKNTKAFL
jgi:D-serine deaminase-like pyridoxal phosphate-dependent protein